MKRLEPPAGSPCCDSGAESPFPCHIDDRERERFLRPQPPIPIPERVRTAPMPGLVCLPLLGAWIHRT